MEISQFFSSKESASYTMCCEGDVHCGVWHWWSNTAPHCTSKQTVVACYCTFLQNHFRPVLMRKRRHLVVQNPIILNDNARSHAAPSVMDLLRRWQREILEHPLYSTDMSPCDCDLFAKVKEPLRGTRYNTRDELIRAIGRSIRNIYKDGRADGVRRLPNIC